jgi:hypothetical protein
MTTTTVRDVYHVRFLSAMRAKQGRASDKVFSLRLGVPLQALAAARDGTHSIGIPLLAAMVRTYPDLEEMAHTYLWALVDAELERKRKVALKE